MAFSFWRQKAKRKTNSVGNPVSHENKVSLDNFRMMGVVGKGAFCKVRMVQHRSTNEVYALKYIRREDMVRSNSVKHMIRERKILERLRHPFICNLRYCFKDKEYLYMAVDMMSGGDLRFHLTSWTFSEDAVRFWIAELASALSYIHSRGIVHRDIKPENVLLDSEGHVSLADFNIATQIKRRRRPQGHFNLMEVEYESKNLHGRSGTMSYLSPEVYTEDGYGLPLDWWSLGVLMYECIYGRRPFPSNDEEELIAQIVSASPPYSRTKPALSSDIIAAVKGFLEPNASLRLGATGIDEVFSMPFFSQYDVIGLEKRMYSPVFVPPQNVSNFDMSHDIEEWLLEFAPLDGYGGGRSSRGGKSSRGNQDKSREQEMNRMIETMFPDYDYATAPAEEFIDFRQFDNQFKEAASKAKSQISDAAVHVDDIDDVDDISSSSSVSSTSTSSDSMTTNSMSTSVSSSPPQLPLIQTTGTYETTTTASKLGRSNSALVHATEKAGARHASSHGQATRGSVREKRDFLKRRRAASPRVYPAGIIGKVGARVVI
ncbi:kinase-like domain-containing protein [Dipodascopsis uninucleata]